MLDYARDDCIVLQLVNSTTYYKPLKIMKKSYIQNYV